MENNIRFYKSQKAISFSLNKDNILIKEDMFMYLYIIYDSVFFIFLGETEEKIENRFDILKEGIINKLPYLWSSHNIKGNIDKFFLIELKTKFMNNFVFKYKNKDYEGIDFMGLEGEYINDNTFKAKFYHPFGEFKKSTFTVIEESLIEQEKIINFIKSLNK